MSDILEKLNDDNEYYKGVGKLYISNSDIKALLTNPASFKADSEEDKNLLIGKLFHCLMLEPEKVKDFSVVNASTRNTKLYKDFIIENKLEIALLEDEFQDTIVLADVMKSNMDFHSMIYDDANEFEVPAIGEIFGAPFKGKADIVGEKYLIDLKTTSDINEFKWSAKKYNYDSQAYIYQCLFGKPLVFLVIDKETKLMGIFYPTPEFIERGANKVKMAVDVYNKFYADGHTADVSEYYIEQDL